MMLKPWLRANIKHEKTTSYNVIQIGLFDKIDNASGSYIIKQLPQWGGGKIFTTNVSQSNTVN